MKELREAIALKGTIIPELTGGLWYLEAPSDVVEPYAVFSFLPANYSRDSANKFQEHFLQINLYDTNFERAEEVQKKLIEILDDSEGSLVMLNYYVIDIRKTLTRNSKLDDVYQLTVQYTIQLMEGNMSRIADYSTAEHLTGARWIDGKPIYRKVIDSGSLPDTIKNINPEIDNLGIIVDMRLMGYNTSVKQFFPAPSRIWTLHYTIGATPLIQIYPDSELYEMLQHSFIIIEYTKE